MGFWGIGLAAHAVSSFAPSARQLVRGREEYAPLQQQVAATPPDELLSESFRVEVGQVKSLLEQRRGSDSASLIKEIDQIVGRIQELAAKRRDLSEQTSEEERQRLEKNLEEAEQKLIAATNADDRRLYQRQFDVLRQRQQAIGKALVVIERLAIRRDVAEQQVKQLRLDLSRDEASSAGVPELTSRLQDIRHEVDARELVDGEIAREFLS